MFEDFDKQTSILSEQIARSLSRRRVLATSVKVTVAAVAGATVGTFLNSKAAFAANCTCNWYGGSGNANCPGTSGCNPSGGNICPTGCTPCTSSDYCRSGYYACIYAGGYWVSCTGLGNCGAGSRECADCKCPNCSHVCTCLSNCICCNCCTPQQVEAEMRRLAAAGMTPSVRAAIKLRE